MFNESEVSKYEEIWKEFLKERKLPNRCSGVSVISYNEFKDLRDKFDLNKAKELVSNLIDGKVLLVKGAYSKNEVNDIKSKVMKFWKENPDTHYKMLEGCPDFHRNVTPQKTKYYSNGGVKHHSFFFRWNKDPYDIKNTFYERWKYTKYIAGLNSNEYENNTPKDGVVDRIQIACWPKKCGGIEKHTDAYNNSYLVVGCYFSSLNNSDFSTGGFYCVDKNNKNIYMEKSIDVGDMGLFIPTIEHGVLPIDLESEDNYDGYSGLGRWWCGLFSEDTDIKENRNTCIPLERSHSDRFV